MIEIEKISKSFDDQHVLHNVSCTFEKGLVNMIIGKSGSGKTVLLKCLVGLTTPSSGQIRYDGRDFTNMTHNQKKLLRRDVGMLFQNSALFDSRTVLENVMFPLDMFSGESKKIRQKRAESCLERVNLSGAAKLYPNEISGGMKKRAAIARAIALEPLYLFCDEPNSGLDPKTSQLIDILIADITRDLNITTVVVSHDMNSVMNIGDKVIFLNEGIKEWEGHKSDVMRSDNKALNDFVFASELFQRIKDATILQETVAQNKWHQHVHG